MFGALDWTRTSKLLNSHNDLNVACLPIPPQGHKILVVDSGVEPLTSSMSTKRSTAELIDYMLAESRGVEPHPCQENRVFKARRRTNPAALLSNITGLRDRSRTYGLKFPELALFQLSYTEIILIRKKYSSIYIFEHNEYYYSVRLHMETYDLF